MIADASKGITDATKEVSSFIDKTGKDLAKAIDQNGDGVLDISDIHTVTDRIREAQEKARRKADLERLKPLFPAEFESPEFVMPKMIRVSEIDKDHAENDVCRGSVGFRTVMDDMSVITIFRGHIDDFGLSFYPELENTVYYVDPCDRDHYIALHEYFAYMKMQRVAELQRIAHSLGARHFTVIYKDSSKSVSSYAVDASVSAKNTGVKVGTEAKHTVSNSYESTTSILAQMDFPAHAPVRPELRYLKKEINIINLIEMRMNPQHPLQHQHFSIEMSNSSGIRIKDAAKIDAMLKTMKVACDYTVESQAHDEAHRILEYDIEF